MEISANSALAMKQSANLQTATIKVMKKQHEMQQIMIDMVAQSARSAPPSGQGTMVDKSV